MTTTSDEGRRPGPTAPAAGAEQAVLDAAEDVVEDLAEGELAPVAVPAMESLDNPRRLLLVHAHPDDETINNGATMARYAASGAAVTLVTCTRGELGEVIPVELANLEGDGDALAEYRTGELAAAMEALGVKDHRFLGAASDVRYQDSGMVYDDEGRAVAPPDMRPDAFAHVPVDDAAAHLVRVLREVRPQVVVTYDPGGGYGHPDHVHAHRVAMRAVDLAADRSYGEGEPWTVSRVFWTAVPLSVFTDGLRELRSAGVATIDPDGPLPSMAVPDARVTMAVDATSQLEAKVAALRAHRTQVVVTGGTFGLSNDLYQPLTGVEYYLPALQPAEDEARAAATGVRDTDLFAGLD